MGHRPTSADVTLDLEKRYPPLGQRPLDAAGLLINQARDTYEDLPKYIQRPIRQIKRGFVDVPLDAITTIADAVPGSQLHDEAALKLGARIGESAHIDPRLTAVAAVVGSPLDPLGLVGDIKKIPAIIKKVSSKADIITDIFDKRIPKSVGAAGSDIGKVDEYVWDWNTKGSGGKRLRTGREPTILRDLRNKYGPNSRELYEASESLWNFYDRAERYWVSKGRPPNNPLRGFGQVWRHPETGVEYYAKRGQFGKYGQVRLDPEGTIKNIRASRDIPSSSIQQYLRGIKESNKKLFNEKIVRHIKNLQGEKARLLAKQKAGTDVSKLLTKVNGELISIQETFPRMFGEHGYALNSPIWKRLTRFGKQKPNILGDIPRFEPGDAKNYHLVVDYRIGSHFEFSEAKTRIESFIHRYYPELVVNYNPDLEGGIQGLIRLEKADTVRVGNKFKGIMSGDIAGIYDFKKLGNLNSEQLRTVIPQIIGYNPPKTTLVDNLPSYPHLIAPPVRVNPAGIGKERVPMRGKDLNQILDEAIFGTDNTQKVKAIHLDDWIFNDY